MVITDLESKKMPEVLLNKDTILMRFHGYSIVISTDSGYIFINGKKMLTTQSDRKYISQFKKEDNLEKVHSRLKSIPLKNDTMLVINKGYDGRIFFHLYVPKEYAKFRGIPFWSASWWNNAKAWFELDMIMPKNIYNNPAIEI